MAYRIRIARLDRSKSLPGLTRSLDMVCRICYYNPSNILSAQHKHVQRRNSFIGCMIQCAFLPRAVFSLERPALLAQQPGCKPKVSTHLVGDCEDRIETPDALNYMQS